MVADTHTLSGWSRRALILCTRINFGRPGYEREAIALTIRKKRKASPSPELTESLAFDDV